MRASEILQSKGRLRIVKAGHRYYLRVEVYTADELEIHTLEREFGGTTRQHNEYIQRWSAQAEDHLLHVGLLLLREQLPGAGLIMSYLAQDSGLDRWDYCFRVLQDWEERCRSFAELDSHS